MPQYRIRTWDAELQSFTPQDGVPAVVNGPGELRAAIRELRACGYDGGRGDSSLLVELVEET